MACGHRIGDGHPACTLPEEHEGNHADGLSVWFRSPVVMGNAKGVDFKSAGSVTLDDDHPFGSDWATRGDGE